VHLTAIKLRGFKSFPDPVEIRLEPGIAVVVGPNGSGKSNVADAIVWAAGNLAPSELRAERSEDVLFAGSKDRPAAEWCEVELLFDNSDGRLEELPFAELSIARRLHRGGEGQYLLNGTPVRRLDLVELLADVGLGRGLHSIVGQGRVEALLSSQPRERRDLLEEAAGLGRFKQRLHRAELKLARVAVDVDRARDLEAEVRKRLRPLALQATAAERAARLERELTSLIATLARLELADLAAELQGLDERRMAATLARGRVDRELQALLAQRAEAEEELADAAGRREAATAALYRLRSAGERLGLRLETTGELLEELRADFARATPRRLEPRPSPGDLRALWVEAQVASRAAALERDSLADALALADDRSLRLERSLAEREGLPPAARALTEAGERLAVSLLDVDPGYERAVVAVLGWRASALVAENPPAALVLLERSRAQGLGSLLVLTPAESPTAPAPPHGPPLPGAERLLDRVRVRPGGESVAHFLEGAWVVPAEGLLGVRGQVAVTVDGHCYAPASGELWYAGETAEAVLLELEARHRELGRERAGLTERVDRARADADAAATRERETNEAYRMRAGERRLDSALLGRLVTLAESLDEHLRAAAAVAERLEAPLRARVDAGALRAGELGGRLRDLGGQEVEARRRLGDAGESSGRIEVEHARLTTEAAAVRRRLDAIDAQPESAAVEEEPSREALEERLRRLERRRETLGQVNPLAKEEYDQEKERLDELAGQRADLETSLAELEGLRADLTETVERRFAETFAAVERNFGEVAAALFPGGEGRLRLTESAEEADVDGAPGIEVELRPAGKRVQRLSLLSGGEKALGAIAFLFALFLARPCPFYLLDEVEASLDDPNIARFLELLRRYADRAQFIVVTHQKRTMEAADTLYGVSMGADGISRIVSRRVPRTEPLVASASLGA